MDLGLSLTERKVQFSTIEAVSKRRGHTTICPYCGEQRNQSANCCCLYILENFGVDIFFHEVGPKPFFASRPISADFCG